VNYSTDSNKDEMRHLSDIPTLRELGKIDKYLLHFFGSNQMFIPSDLLHVREISASFGQYSCSSAF
jgi:hypothetical protein